MDDLDPDSLLDEIQQECLYVQHHGKFHFAEDALAFVNKVEALDTYLNEGGTLPKAWRYTRPA